jgi:hypothetical protein
VRPKLRALEKNILKYRALQMVLLLHEVESFREFLIGSIRATDSLSPHPKRLPLGTKHPFEKAVTILVAEDILTEEEAEGLRKIIDQRNLIAHEVHQLVMDVTRPRDPVERKSLYDYAALIRFEHIRKKVSSGMSAGQFVFAIGIREHFFEQAEATYREELHRLRKRINKQIRIRERTA